MNKELFSSIAMRHLVALCLVAGILCCGVAAAAETPSMKTYCDLPPASAVPSNLLLLIDNSASMYDLAYTDANPDNYCLDNSYDNSKSYVGYFDQNTLYKYDGAKFVASTSFPGNCADAKTDYLCVNLAGSKPYRYVTDLAASGRFLNWLSMSKYDVEKWVLTGGKFVPTDGTHPEKGGVVQGESRGCQGKRFVKMIGDTAAITFALRGPILTDTDYLSLPNHAGLTRIEIYDAPFKKTQCLQALKDWRDALTGGINNPASGLAKFQTDASECLGDRNEAGFVPATLSKGYIYAEIMTDCYWSKIGNNPFSTSNPGAMTRLKSLENDCSDRYINYYNGDDSRISKNLDSICARKLTHAPRGKADNTIDSTGYLGIYFQNGSFSDDEAQKVLDEMSDYCNEIVTPYVADPALAAGLGYDAGITSFVLDAGVFSMGNVARYGPTGLPIVVKAAVGTPPTGLVQQYSGQINFGAMAFNDNGAGSECGAGTLPCVKYCVGGSDSGKECFQNSDCAAKVCKEVRSDGGRIIAYINDPAKSPGDSSAVVGAVNAQSATSWTPFAEAFYNAIGYFANRTDLRLQSGDFDAAKPPSLSSCQGNHVLVISDGMSTADSNSAMEALASLYASSSGGLTGKDSANSCPTYAGSRSLDDLAWLAQHRNIKSFSTTSASAAPPSANDQFVTTHVMFIGTPNRAAAGQCNPETLLTQTAASGGGFYAGSPDPADWFEKVKAILQKIAGVRSGEGGIFSTGDANGALFLKSEYGARKFFDQGTSAAWAGELQSLWYYIDSFLQGSDGSRSAIREDSVSDFALNLSQDKIVRFRYDAASDQSFAYLTADANGDGYADGTESKVDPAQVKSLWRGGRLLWSRNLDTAPRTIYTALSAGPPASGSTGFTRFSWLSPDNSIALQPYLDASGSDAATKLGNTVKVMKYLHGYDFAGDPTMRSRTVRIGADSGVWKLGDSISSTPRVQSPVPIGSYHLPSPKGYNDVSYRSFLASSEYKNRGSVFVGANDGMLHAFKAGTLDFSTAAGPVKATLSGSDPGAERWAFIPRHALPYLKYLSDPAYRHLYFMDGPLTLVDASIGAPSGCDPTRYWQCAKLPGVLSDALQDSLGRPLLDPNKNSWKTVLIAGMGLGGASAISCGAGEDCVPTPLADPANPAARLGYSSYVALDVTDADNPKFLWEFSNPALGFATTGPAIVRVADAVSDHNGRWFAVFGSGPTGPIDSATSQFLGHSNQKLRFFVVDLANGQLVQTIDTGIENAFAGSLSGGAADLDRIAGNDAVRYQDDVIYVGFVNDDGTKSWNKGGVGRILVHSCLEDQPPCSDPAGPLNAPLLWHWSKIMDTPGPVTAGIAKVQDPGKHALWLYFGTGRFYYDLRALDDKDAVRSLYGIKEPCYDAARNTLDKTNNCSDRPFSVEPTNQTTYISGTVAQGWRIELDPASGATGAERLLSAPTVLRSGAVLFPTFQPVQCQQGGSYLWEVKYDTGGAVPDGAVKGIGLVQLSSGAVAERQLYGLPEKGGRRSDRMDGKAGPPRYVTNDLPGLKKIIHIQER